MIYNNVAFTDYLLVLLTEITTGLNRLRKIHVLSCSTLLWLGVKLMGLKIRIMRQLSTDSR
jgi:hypothetical protein